MLRARCLSSTPYSLLDIIPFEVPGNPMHSKPEAENGCPLACPMSAPAALELRLEAFYATGKGVVRSANDKQPGKNTHWVRVKNRHRN